MIRSLAKRILASPPVYPVLLRRALAKRPVTILCYHTLSADEGGPDAWTSLRLSDFHAQVALLKRHYRITDLDEALAPGDTDRPLAVLTFDDGDVGLHRHLLPLLKEEELPVTIYVASGQIETRKRYWFDRVMNACRGPGRLEIDLTDAGLGTWVLEGEGESRWRVQSDLHRALKRVDPDKRETLADRIAALAEDSPGETLGPMTVDELKDLAALPHVTIGGHSHCHNLLDQIPLEAARESVAHNRALLEDWTGREIRHFAYPNGNHNADLRALMKEMGFTSATVLDNALAWTRDDPYALSRLGVGRYDSLDSLRLRLAGL